MTAPSPISDEELAETIEAAKANKITGLQYDETLESICRELQQLRRPRPPGEPQEDSALMPRVSPLAEIPGPSIRVTVENGRETAEITNWEDGARWLKRRAVKTPNATAVKTPIATVGEPRGEARPNPAALPAEAVEAAREFLRYRDSFSLSWGDTNTLLAEKACRALVALASPQEKI